MIGDVPFLSGFYLFFYGRRSEQEVFAEIRHFF